MYELLRPTLRKISPYAGLSVTMFLSRRCNPPPKMNGVGVLMGVYSGIETTVVVFINQLQGKTLLKDNTHWDNTEVGEVVQKA